MIIPFATSQHELEALQAKSIWFEAQINAMKLTHSPYHNIEQMQNMNRDCIRAIAKLWAYKSKR